MLLTSVNVGVVQAAADVFSREGDLDRIYHAVNDNIDLIYRQIFLWRLF